MNREVLIVFAILALCLIYALAAVPARADAAATAYRVDSEPPAAEPIMTCEEKTKVCYELSEEERAIVESVVMAEAGAEPYIGKMAVAQCILDACKSEHERPAEIVKSFGYTEKRPEPNEDVKRAVSAVFDSGEVATDAEILYFYAPALVSSEWHESQTYVCTIGGHRFFEEVRK